MKKKMDYIDTEDLKKIVRFEIVLTPLLVIFPFLVGFFLIYDWYNRDFLLNQFDLLGELMLGLLIIAVNIIFDIPFIRYLYKKNWKKIKSLFFVLFYNL